MPEPFVIALEGADGEVRLSPPMFLDNQTNVSPADLSQFAPQGNGIYGLQFKDINPFAMGESMEATSGVVFFGVPKSKEDFLAFLRVLEIASPSGTGSDEHARRYWAFEMESRQPREDGYLKQLRVIDRFGLKYLFNAIDDPAYREFPLQPVTLPEFLWLFIEDQARRYGSSWMSAKPELRGSFGGDGDFACEELCFGLMVENSYHKVYRIWSRAWLVTK